MKRLVIVAMVLALVGAFAFADAATLKWSANTYTGFALATQGSNTNIEAYDYSWVGAGAIRFGATLTSADGNAGFNSRLQMSQNPLFANFGPGTANGDIAVFNQLNGWVKLFGGVLTVRGGILDDYTIATPIWNNYGRDDGDFGLSLDLAPVAGLDIVYFQPVPVTAPIANILSPAGGGFSIVGVAYAAKDIGKIELGAQLTSLATTATTGTQLYLGGNVSAIKGLTLQLEAIYNLYTTGTFTALENVSYSAGALTVGTYVGEATNAAGTFNWGLEPTVSYKIMDNFSVNAIVNVYSDKGQTWMSPIDAGAFAGIAAGETSWGAGVSGIFSLSGANFTVGDYYAGGTNGGNAFYVNLDVAL